MQGDGLGPTDGSPCPNWVPQGNTEICPQEPTCSELNDCNNCAIVDDCAWCASANKCMTVSEVFAKDCRGTVFDSPCPDSFVGVNRVVGNLHVESDSVFGGGHFLVSGNVSSSQDFKMAVDTTGFTVKSAGVVSLKAGENSAVNSEGGSVLLSAGSGTSLNRGRGGSVEIHGGNGQGVVAAGGGGVGGDIVLKAGSSVDSTGGNVNIFGGQSHNGSGGKVILQTSQNGYVDVLSGSGIRLRSSYHNEMYRVLHQMAHF